MILATGSSPVIPDIPGIDLPQVMTSRDILRMDDWNFDCLTVIGGGIGQSRICMFFLRKAHIGEVQASIWPDGVRAEAEAHNIHLL